MAIGKLLFVAREPVTRQRNGSTTAVLNLLALLTDAGFSVTVLITTGSSRSPRLLFRSRLALPTGGTLRVPGYLRLGTWYVRPLQPLSWIRLLVRALRRVPQLHLLGHAISQRCGDRLCAHAWDLTEPTPREAMLVRQEVQALQPSTVLTNYAFWGPLLENIAGVHRAILMHDLLAEHVRLSQAGGLPLDCPEISAAQEARWLNAADTLLAIQHAEAESVRPRVRGEVMVQPIRLEPHASSATPQPGHCLFVGSNTPPNVQGLRWLLQEVWPHVLRAQPDATLAVAGTVRAGWTGDVPPGVTLLGPVDALDAEHDRAAVCAVPLQVGSGLKIKLLEALAHGKATVSTSVGVQGLELWADGTITVADDPAAFAAGIIALLQDGSLRRAREAAATALVRTHFSAGSAEERALVDRLARGPLPR